MIGPIHPFRAPMASGAAPANHNGATPATDSHASEAPASEPRPAGSPAPAEPILCGHCGRTASNGISCQGICVADSGY